MINMVIAGKDCEGCKYALINEADKSMVKVRCIFKNKEYIWGQAIPCGDKKVNGRK